MGFSVLPRPYALVLGSHEDDVLMTEGVVGLKEQISIGFIELSEDIAQRLPVSILTVDAISTYILMPILMTMLMIDVIADQHRYF